MVRVTSVQEGQDTIANGLFVCTIGSTWNRRPRGSCSLVDGFARIDVVLAYLGDANTANLDINHKSCIR